MSHLSATFRQVTRLRSYPLLVSLALWACAGPILTFSGVATGPQMLYVVQPLAIIGFSVWAWLLTKRRPDMLRHKEDKAALVLIIMISWLILYFLSGLVLTFTRNPLFSPSVDVITSNLVAYAITGILFEFIRHRIVLADNRRYASTLSKIIIVIFSIIQLNWISIITSNDALKFSEVLIGSALPIVVQNIMLTYLAYTTGFASMVIYKVSWIMIAAFLPIIPKYDWYLTGISTIMVSTVTFLLVSRSTRGNPEKRSPRINHAHIGTLTNGMMVAALVAVVLLISGALPYKATAIMSNSMQPVYQRGDMVIMQKINTHKDIHIGDILQYTKDGRSITHRVVDINKSDTGEYEIITKGDNNQSDDPWVVTIGQVSGVVKLAIPAIGYPTVLLHEVAGRGV